MTELRVIGSGLGRTGTKSLHEALQLLLPGKCHHMFELAIDLDRQLPLLQPSVEGGAADWDALLDGYSATVDWPLCAYWEELAERYPDAIILHSERPAEDWWRSASATIFQGMHPDQHTADSRWFDYVAALFDQRFCEGFLEPGHPNHLDQDAAIAAFDRWNAHVRATADPDRLVVFPTGSGWAPLCDALGVPVPDEPYPHSNTTAEFQARRAGHDPD